MKCRKRIRRCQNRGVTRPPGSARGKPEACPSGIRHVGGAKQSGSCTERENLDGDAKGKGTSGSNREAESTDAPARGGLLRSSDEAGVMPGERREQAIAIWIGSTGNGRNPMFNGRRQPSRGGTSRMTRECQVRICERLGVKFPGPTRHDLKGLQRANLVRSTSGTGNPPHPPTLTLCAITGRRR